MSSNFCFPEFNDFYPTPQEKYIFEMETGNKMKIVFTETKIPRSEMYMGHDAFECFDENNKRYVCHISECCCDRDEMVISLIPEDLIPKNFNNLLFVKKIFVDETKLVYLADK